MKIGHLLRYYRKLNNLSQTELAEKADINEKYYSRLERDENNPTYVVLCKIVSALDVKMMQFAIAIEESDKYGYIFYPDNTKDGTFIKELPPRFVAEVIHREQVHKVYVASSVKLTKLINLENSKVNLCKINGDSKFEYSLFTLDKGSIKLLLNLNIVNKLFYELYCVGVLSGYYWYGSGLLEKVCDGYKTDYYFKQEKLIVENKTILSETSVCDYPIETSERYEIQFNKIHDLLCKKYKVRINYFILSPWTTALRFKGDYIKQLAELQQQGLELFFYYLYYEKDILRVSRVILDKKDTLYNLAFVE